MKNFKKITLGLLGATILSLGLYACSNDNEATVASSTSTEQTTLVNKAELEFVSIPLPEYLQSYEAEIVVAEAEIELLDVEGNSFSGIIRYGIDAAGKLNQVEFSSNLFETGLITQDLFVNNPDITNTIFGSSSPHGDCVKGCTDNYVKDGKSTPGYGHCIAGCYIESTGRLIESIGRAIGNALESVTITISKVIKK